MKYVLPLFSFTKSMQQRPGFYGRFDIFQIADYLEPLQIGARTWMTMFAREKHLCSEKRSTSKHTTKLEEIDISYRFDTEPSLLHEKYNSSL